MFVGVCVQDGEILKKVKEHTKQINDLQTSVDLTMFISASKDNTAKVPHCSLSCVTRSQILRGT